MDALNVRAASDQGLRVSRRNHGHFLEDDFLRPAVEHRAHFRIKLTARGEHGLAVGFVGPETDIERGTERRCLFIEQHVKEIIGIAMCRPLPEQRHFMFAVTGAVAVGPPFVPNNFNREDGAHRCQPQTKRAKTKGKYAKFLIGAIIANQHNLHKRTFDIVGVDI